MASNNGRFSSMILNGTAASGCIAPSVYADSLKFWVVDGQITSWTFGHCVLGRSQGVNLLRPRASSISLCTSAILTLE